MKQIETYPVFKAAIPGYHFEGPISTSECFCWVQIHATPEAKSPGVVQWVKIPEGGFSKEGLDLEIKTKTFSEPVGAVMPTETESKVLVAKERSLVLINLDENAEEEPWGEEVDENPEIRLNDCRAGYDGQAYLGFMAYDCETPIGKWGSYTPTAGYQPLIENIKISNGFDWTEEKDGTRTLIFVDSKSGKVDTHDDEANGVTESSEVWKYNHSTTGELSEKQTLVNLTEYVERQVSGCPVVGDGGVMAFDEQGKAFYIVAEYNGAAAHIIDVETGAVTARINIPALKITSCCWVNDQLVFTTTREGIQDLDPNTLDEDKKIKLEGSGNMYWCQPEGLKGRTPFRIKL